MHRKHSDQASTGNRRIVTNYDLKAFSVLVVQRNVYTVNMRWSSTSHGITTVAVVSTSAHVALGLWLSL